MSRQRNETLQALCCDYLLRLRYMAKKHGIDVDAIIRANRRKECEATRKEVELLSRACDDERISRKDIPKLLGESYRQSESNGVFGKIKKLKRVGIYSKIGAILIGNELRALNGG